MCYYKSADKQADLCQPEVIFMSDKNNYATELFINFIYELQHRTKTVSCCEGLDIANSMLRRPSEDSILSRMEGNDDC
jgi:hypothetical protein